MGFLVDLLWIAGILFGLLCLITEPGWTIWTVATLGGGYIGHEAGGLVGTALGLVIGAVSGGIVVGLAWGVRELTKDLWRRANKIPAARYKFKFAGWLGPQVGFRWLSRGSRPKATESQAAQRR